MAKPAKSPDQSQALHLAEKGIRVNAVAPGPIWTPLIVANFNDVAEFRQDIPMGRAELDNRQKLSRSMYS